MSGIIVISREERWKTERALEKLAKEKWILKDGREAQVDIREIRIFDLATHYTKHNALKELVRTIDVFGLHVHPIINKTFKKLLRLLLPKTNTRVSKDDLIIAEHLSADDRIDMKEIGLPYNNPKELWRNIDEEKYED